MEQSTLAEILGIEQQIRARLDAEREQASQWLENARRDIERSHEAALAQLREDARQRQETAVQAARDRVAAAVRDAESAASAQLLISDAALRPLVCRHLAELLPEDAR
jgi:F0F1-type ATP synthase membrane subunit b/b'